MSHNMQYYNGIMFQFLKDSPKAEHGKQAVKMDLLAVGGRYDSLIDYFRHPTSPPLYGVGISISVMKLLDLVCCFLKSRNQLITIQ